MYIKSPEYSNTNKIRYSNTYSGMRQTEHFGTGTISTLKEITAKYNPKKILLFTGKSSYASCGAKEKIESLLQNTTYIRFSDFETNPKVEDIKQAIKTYKDEDCDFIVAVGGGSVIDVAKATWILQANKGTPEEYIKKEKQVQPSTVPFIAIPTTSGSGSEATPFAVAYIGKTKYSLAHPSMLPTYAIIDPQLTQSLPKKVTAATGMDAFCQAVESFWCVNSTDESKKYAKQAIELILKSFAKAANDPDIEARQDMAKAANVAGKAIAISKTTACHAISYPITSYFNVPHGQAVGLTLAPMLAYNEKVTQEDVLDKRGVDYVKSIVKEITSALQATSTEQAKQKITELMKSAGLATRLTELNITEKDIDLIVKNGFNPDRVKNNPRIVTEQAMRNILHSIL